MKIKRHLISISILTLACAALSAAPVKTGGVYEITVENVDIGGSPAPGYNNGATGLICAVGEPGGITKLTNGIYSVQAGYFGQDLIAPRYVNLSTTMNAQDGLLNLSWVAPGDDHSYERLEAGTRFFIATTTVLSNAQSEAYWYSRRNAYTFDFTISTGPVTPGDNAVQSMTGLVEGNTYYFRVWTLDQAANWSDISAGSTMQFMWAPGPITNIRAYPGLYGRSVRLVWTAPGDDGYYSQLPAGSKYAIQRSTWAGVSFSTSSIDAVYVSTYTVNPGDYQAYNLTSLQQGVTYYVRMWTADERVNWSSVSNSSTAYATWVIIGVTLPTTYYHFGTVGTGVSTDTNKAAIVRNTGNVYQSYSLRATNSDDFALGTAVGENTVILRSAFHATRPGSLAAFDTNSNILGLTDVLSTGSVFTIDGSHRGVGVDPFPSISSEKDRNLWFKLSTPIAVSTTNYQSIYITITGEESYP